MPRYKICSRLTQVPGENMATTRMLLVKDINKTLKSRTLKNITAIDFRVAYVGDDFLKNVITVIATVYTVKSSRIANRKTKFKYLRHFFKIC